MEEAEMVEATAIVLAERLEPMSVENRRALVVMEFAVIEDPIRVENPNSLEVIVEPVMLEYIPTDASIEEALIAFGRDNIFRRVKIDAILIREEV